MRYIPSTAKAAIIKAAIRAEREAATETQAEKREQIAYIGAITATAALIAIILIATF